MQPAGWDPIRGRWVALPPGHPYGYTQQPPRPTYREPHPIRAAGVWAGIGAAMAWHLIFSMLGSTARSYSWATIVAGVLALVAALLLNRFGDRGVALGVAVTSAFGVSIAGLVVGISYLGGDWILW